MSGILTKTTEIDIESLTLDDIMELEEPQRTEVIEQWLNPDMSVMDEGATLKAFDKNGKVSNYTFKMADGTEVKFGPRGRNFNRRIAYILMQRYGKRGRYFGMHQATGMRKRSDMAQWTSMQKEDFKDATVETHYLSHVPKKQEFEDGGSEDLGGNLAAS